MDRPTILIAVETLTAAGFVDVGYISGALDYRDFKEPLQL